jgi:hypothetical protein
MHTRLVECLIRSAAGWTLETQPVGHGQYARPSLDSVNNFYLYGCLL